MGAGVEGRGAVAVRGRDGRVAAGGPREYRGAPETPGGLDHAG